MYYYIIFIPVVLALLYSAYLIYWLRSKKVSDEKMNEISKAIQKGSTAYLNRQYKTVAVVAAVLVVLIYFVFNWETALGFLVGSLASAITGYIGMNVAVRSNAKTAEAAKQGLAPALSLAFKAGSVTGLLVAAFGSLGVAGF